MIMSDQWKDIWYHYWFSKGTEAKAKQILNDVYVYIRG